MSSTITTLESADLTHVTGGLDRGAAQRIGQNMIKHGAVGAEIGFTPGVMLGAAAGSSGGPLGIIGGGIVGGYLGGTAGMLGGFVTGGVSQLYRELKR